MAYPAGKTHLLHRETGLKMEDGGDRAPAPKRAKIDHANGGSSTLSQLKTLVNQLPDAKASAANRKSELKGWATTIVEALETKELNEYCLYIKQ
jgi:hypothetical protein